MLKYTDISTNIQQVKIRYKILCYCWRICTVTLFLSFSNIYTANSLYAFEFFNDDISLKIHEESIPLNNQALLFDIVINEFLPKPTNEIGYIELLNASQKSLNLNNWILGIGNSKKTIIYSELVYPDDIVLIGPEPPSNNHESDVHYIKLDFNSIPKTQGSIWISTNESILIDSIRYERSWSDINIDGLSLEKINPTYIGTDIQNWKAHPNSNSFGFQNDAVNSESFDLNILSAIFEQDSIYVRFNYHVHLNAETSVKINSATVAKYDWNMWVGNEIKFKTSDNNWVRNEPTNLEIHEISLLGDENAQSFTIEIAHPPEKGDLSINEILYHPIKDRYSSFSDQSEFIEIKNHRPFKISLKNIIIRDGIDKFGKFRSWVPINSPDWSIQGNDYAVIFADTASSIQDAQLIQFFNIVPDHNWGQVQSSTLGLITKGREVVLSDNNGIALDSIYYLPEMHHPLVRDTKGRSLEKFENLSTSTGTKWITSAHILGATPSEMNTSFRPNEETLKNSMVQLEPNPFSPDQDGQNDVAVIGLSFNEPGYLLRISIFDRYGYKINDLIKDEIIGTTFSTYWDGTNSSGKLSSTGVYIIWINAIHRENKSELNFKKPIVLVRKK